MNPVEDKADFLCVPSDRTQSALVVLMAAVYQVFLVYLYNNIFYNELL